jgi:hypothetical protein
MQQPAARQIRPVLIGISLTILMLVAIAYLADQRRAASQRPTPQLSIVHPTNGPIDSPLVVRFTSSSPLRLGATGWGTGDLHLHALINGTSHMPAAADIEVTDSVYVWTIPSAPRGSVVISLGWGDQRHRELRSGASDTVRPVIR